MTKIIRNKIDEKRLTDNKEKNKDYFLRILINYRIEESSVEDKVKEKKMIKLIYIMQNCNLEENYKGLISYVCQFIWKNNEAVNESFLIKNKKTLINYDTFCSTPNF